MRLTFDVTVPGLSDTDAAAALLAGSLAPLLSQSPGLPAGVAAGSIVLVAANRLTTGLTRGDRTVEAVDGQTWRKVAP